MRFKVGPFMCELSVKNGDLKAKWIPWRPMYLNKAHVNTVAVGTLYLRIGQAAVPFCAGSMRLTHEFRVHRVHGFVRSRCRCRRTPSGRRAANSSEAVRRALERQSPMQKSD
jgi:hypothetical protein